MLALAITRRVSWRQVMCVLLCHGKCASERCASSRRCSQELTGEYPQLSPDTHHRDLAHSLADMRRTVVNLRRLCLKALCPT